jgi:hypothetical protein
MKKIVISYANSDNRELYSNVMTPAAKVQMAAVKMLKSIVGGYKPVAEFEYDDRKSVEANLEDAYRTMQNGVVTDSWTLSPPDGLTALVDPINHDGREYGHRSASMGDIFTVDGKEYVVASFGFKEVE